MTRKSPNKRKSVSATEEVTPKKVKPTTEEPKPTPAKTPKSAKKEKKQQNATPDVGITKDVPKSEKKNEEKQNGDAGQTPKSTKKNKKLGVDSPPKVQKFEGTTKMNQSTEIKKTILSHLPQEKIQSMTKRQRKRLAEKLRKQAKLTKNANTETNIVKKTVEELNQANKKKNKKNKKEKSILNKITEGGNVQVGGKKKKKGGETNTKKPEEVELPNSDEEKDNESDYEVETEVKPIKVSKKMNETNDDGDDDDDDDSDEYAEVDGDEDEDEKEGSDAEDDDDEENEDDGDEDDDDEEDKEQTKSKNKQKTVEVDLKKSGILNEKQSRYVLFVNNLPYIITKEQIKEHFADKCELIDVRLPLDQKTSKPRGFGYIEVKNESSYQNALGLHHSFIGGRRINVQYTQPGTKNSEEKKKEIKKKNLKLHGMKNKGMFGGGPKNSQKRFGGRGKKQNFEKKAAAAK